MSENNGELIKTVVKVSSMVIMFLMILIVGLIPIKSKAFKSNQVLDRIRSETIITDWCIFRGTIYFSGTDSPST